MQDAIPFVIQILYDYYISQPEPELWPEEMRSHPVKGHVLWSFYQGLSLGIQFADACLEKI